MGRFNLEDYEPVEDRLAKFYGDHPEGRVTTELVHHGDGEWIVKAFVFRADGDWPVSATGYAHERTGDGMVNKTSALENCETSAVGRALANLGYAPKGKRPSREEMDKVQRSEAKAKPKPEPTSPKRLLMDRLKQEGVDPQSFVDLMQSTYGVQRLDDLEDADRIKVVDGVTKGGLCDQLKEVA